MFIIVLFIPGYLFKRFYFSGKFTRQFTLGDFAERVITSLFWGVVVQIITFSVFYYYAEINLAQTGSSATKLLDQLAKYDFNLGSDISPFACLAYVSASMGMGIFLGYSLHKLVRFLKIDVKVKALRFTNEWHYLFSGANIKATQRLMGKGKIEMVSLDIVADRGDGTTALFKGILNNYTTTPDGQLETISITGAERYHAHDAAFHKIEGDILLIPYSKVQNINLKYIVKKRTPFTFTGEFAMVRNLGIAFFFIAVLSTPFIISIYCYARLLLFKTILAIVMAWFGQLLIASFFAVMFKPRPVLTGGQLADKKPVLWVTLLIVLLALIADLSGLYYLLH